ncbi:MAG: hypothetical protein Q7R39_02610 [Dehalococcoidia bacterium]|nr:hypothetical protein [Dehalococcoidia bacterium]
MKKLDILLTVAMVLAMVSPLASPAAAADADYDIPGGHFFTQANGQGGAGGTGYSITDDGNIPFWTRFKVLGGVTAIGYVSSKRFTYKGFTNQATQKYVLQWQPSGLFYLNVFDELSAAGKNSWLESVRGIPKPDTFDEAGKTFDQITAARLTLLDANPAIKAVYMASADPVSTHGLPTTKVVDVGPAYVIRNQRDAIQQWKTDMPWAKAGAVTIVNGGDIFKEAGLLVGDAVTPENPPGSNPAPTPTPTAAPVPTAAPAPQFPYNPQGVTWEPNCGLVAIKMHIMYLDGGAVNDVRVVVAAAAGSWSTISVPTGQESRDAGWTNVVLRTDPVNEPWNVWMIDDGGRQISPTVNVVTDTKSCSPTGTGHQVATITFVKTS